jgi:hypothetical protein
LGQGTGIAAALAAAQGKGTSEACTVPGLIHQIQQEILRQDGFLIGVANADPHDLALSAKVTASDHREGGEPQNVIDGFTRITTGPHGTRPGAMPEGTHRWMSGKLPAWLELQWDKPVTLSRLQLTFDTGLHRWFSLTQSDGVHARNIWGPQPESIRDYNLVAETPAGPVTIAEVRGNYLRRRTHDFAPVATTRIRIEVLATNGIDHARVVEVRAYR